jgi:hypothetical protein
MSYALGEKLRFVGLHYLPSINIFTALVPIEAPVFQVSTLEALRTVKAGQARSQDFKSTRAVHALQHWGKWSGPV